MKFLSILFFAFLLTACGSSSSSSSSSTTSEADKKEMVLKACMKSAGLDLNNPNDKVSPSQLAEIEKCLGNFGYKF